VARRLGKEEPTDSTKCHGLLNQNAENFFWGGEAFLKKFPSLDLTSPVRQ
jgi:hypothetical protein